jgi:hypothetical protein
MPRMHAAVCVVRTSAFAEISSVERVQLPFVISFAPIASLQNKQKLIKGTVRTD